MDDYHLSQSLQAVPGVGGRRGGEGGGGCTVGPPGSLTTRFYNLGLTEPRSDLITNTLPERDQEDKHKHCLYSQEAREEVRCSYFMCSQPVRSAQGHAA